MEKTLLMIDEEEYNEEDATDEVKKEDESDSTDSTDKEDKDRGEDDW